MLQLRKHEKRTYSIFSIVWLCGVHPTAKSSSTVCITRRSQTPHRRVKSEIFLNLWFLLKGPSGEILLGGNTFIMKEKIWRTFFWFARPKIMTPWSHAHRGVEFFELFDQISQQNRNRIRKYFSLFIRGTDRFESWKNGAQKSRDTLLLSGKSFLGLKF